MKKFVLALTASAVIAFGFVGLLSPKTANAYAASFKYDDVYYETKDDGTLAVYKLDSKSTRTSVTIPAWIDGKKVTSISKDAFRKNWTIEEVYLPATVTAIDDYAFYNTSLKTIDLGGVTTIGNYAFYDASLKSIDLGKVTEIGDRAFAESSLEKVKIGDSLTTIGDYVFSNCYYLESVDLGSSVETIGNYAFWRCEHLASIEFPASLQTISGYAFGENKSLKSVFIPNSVTTVGVNAFGWCENLKQINIPTTLTEIPASMCIDCSLEEIVIPSNITKIGSFAFYNCNFKNVTIPDSVTEIGGNAFERCELLESIKLPNNLVSIGGSAFRDCGVLKNISIPSTVESIGAGAFMNCASLESIVIPDKVTAIGDYTFDGCTNLGSIDLGKGVKTIGSYAFSDCESLKGINLPSNLVTIPEGAFSGCTSIDLVIPDTVENIEKNAFKDCSSLSSFKFSKSIKTIGENALQGCKSIKSITIPEVFTEIPDYVFSETGIETVVIPNSVTKIGAYAFCNCEFLESVTIPDTVTSIASGAFKGCQSLKSVIVPKEIKDIDTETFSGCISLSEVVLGDSVECIGNRAFASCLSLKTIKLPESLTAIKADAFNSSGLTNIEIPKAVAELGIGAFRYCEKLSSIKFNNSLKEFEDFTFLRCIALKNFEMPDSIESIGFMSFAYSGIENFKCGKAFTTVGSRAFEGCESLKHIEFNNKLESIEYQGFNGCTSLESIEIPVNNIVIENYPFQSCMALKKIKIDGDIDKCGRYAFGYTGLQEFEITGSIGLLGECAFCGLQDLKSVKFGGSIDRIDYNAFTSCNSLKELVLPGDIKYISTAAFAGCHALEYAELGGPLDLTGAIFNECIALKKVVLKDGVTSIGDGTFGGCLSLEEVVVPDSLEEIQVSAFYGNYDSGLLKFKMTCSCQNKAAFDYSVNEYASAKATLNLIHKFGEPTIVPSTCSTEGYKIAECLCGEVDKTTYSKDLNNHESIVADKAVAPAINHSGLTEGSHCEACKTVIVAQEVIPALTPTPTTTPVPTAKPTVEVTPTEEVKPTATPTPVVTAEPTKEPTSEVKPTTVPAVTPTEEVTPAPTNKPTEDPAITPTATVAPTVTAEPTAEPTVTPVEESGVAGFSERLYTTCLGRDSEAAGKDYWTKELKGGKTGAEVARGFFFSDELAKQNLSDEEFITRLYKTFMDRDPEADGMKYWLEVIKDENGRAIVFDGFVNSQEWANICLKYGIRSGGLATPSFEKEASAEVKGFAERLYTTCLGRESEEAGLEYWAQELANLRKTGTEAALGFFFSDEFVGQNVSDKEFVTRLYKTFMNREPEKDGFDYWMDSLKNGASREQVFYGFATAPEFGDLCGDAGIIA